MPGRNRGSEETPTEPLVGPDFVPTVAYHPFQETTLTPDSVQAGTSRENSPAQPLSTLEVPTDKIALAKKKMAAHAAQHRGK